MKSFVTFILLLISVSAFSQVFTIDDALDQSMELRNAGKFSSAIDVLKDTTQYKIASDDTPQVFYAIVSTLLLMR